MIASNKRGGAIRYVSYRMMIQQQVQQDIEAVRSEVRYEISIIICRLSMDAIIDTKHVLVPKSSSGNLLFNTIGISSNDVSMTSL